MEKWNEVIQKLLSKKYVANLLVILALAVMALIVTGDFFSLKPVSGPVERNPTLESSNYQEGTTLTEEEIIERRLKRILEEIKGAGQVEVMLTFEMGTEIVPALNRVESKDVTEEKDANGGTRILSSENITTNTVISSDGKGNQPLVLKEIKPQVKGVIVVAEGADQVEVKAKLYEAVKTVLQIPGHRVEVYPKN